MTRTSGVTVNQRPAGVALALALLLPGAALLLADEPQVTVAASATFKTYCASCHGLDAKGDGPLAENLRTAPADLTRLAKHNRGEFDAGKVHRIIDGRQAVKGHGGPDMPIWGDAFKQSGEGYSEEAVKARIAALVAYLASIQERP